MHPLSSLFSAGSQPVVADLDELDLAQRLRGEQGPTLMRQMHERLDTLQAELTQRIHHGADAQTYQQLQAAREAVKSARDILQRLPVSFKVLPDHPLG